MTFHRFGHNNKNFVKLGDKVTAGQKIAEVGTGNDQYSGHLHYDCPKKEFGNWTNYVFGWTKEEVKNTYSNPYNHCLTVFPSFHHLGWDYLELATYGNRKCYHPGLDLNGPGAGNTDVGQSIFSPVDGEVVYCYSGSGKNYGWGKLLVIKELEQLQKNYHGTEEKKYYYGLDCSHHQGIIDWGKVKTDFVIQKCTQGINFLDATYVHNKQACEERDIPFGSYHFADGGDPIKEAAWYLKNCGDEQLVLDWEIENPNPVDWCNKFIEHIAKVTGKQCLLYTNEARANKYKFKHPMWIARYGTNDGTMQKEPTQDWLIWQYTSKGKVDGIEGNVDMNVAKIDLEPEEPVPPIPESEKPPVELPVTPSEPVQVAEAENPTPVVVPALLDIIINLIKLIWKKLKRLF